MHPNSYYQVICECGHQHNTEAKKLTCSCGRELVIEWKAAKAETPKVTPITRRAA